VRYLDLCSAAIQNVVPTETILRYAERAPCITRWRDSLSGHGFFTLIRAYFCPLMQLAIAKNRISQVLVMLTWLMLFIGWFWQRAILKCVENQYETL
jgi:hypothetical protein